MASGQLWERRDTYRVTTPGAEAECSQADVSGCYQVRDISPGGALLADGPPMVVGDRVHVLLMAPGRLIPTSGRVIRQHLDDSHTQIGVAFEHPWPGVKEAIEEMIVDFLIHHRSVEAGPP